MSNETQLAKWREEARKIVHNEPAFTESENVCDWYVGGYLRAKQETEQARKDERKQTLEQALAICNDALSFPDSKNYVSDKIKELINEQ